MSESDQNAKQAAHGEKIRLERNLMETFGVTRSEARLALKKESQAQNLRILGAATPAPAIAPMQVFETVHEIRRGSVGPQQDTGNAPSSPPPLATPVRMICFVDGVLGYYDMQATFVSTV